MLLLHRSQGVNGTGKHSCPVESTQGTLTYQEVWEDIGKLNGLKTVEATRKKSMLRHQSFPLCLFLAGEDMSQQADRET